MSLFSPFDLHLFHEGKHERLYEKLGARAHPQRASRGAWFGIWAPDAGYISVVGTFNNWDRGAHPLQRTVDPGIWEGFVPGVHDGALYKFHVERSGVGEEIPDPMAFASEAAPGNASIFFNQGYEWHDMVWQGHRRSGNSLEAPIAISTGRPHEARELGFTHVLLPAVHGLAPSASPLAFMAETDEIHNHQLGAVAEMRAPVGFSGMEAQSARLSAAVWWLEQYHLDLLLGRDLILDHGWSECLFQYFALDPGARSGGHHLLTDRMQWAFEANFMLPLVNSLPPAGNDSPAERLAIALLYATPGKKLLRPPSSDGARLLTGELNHLYRGSQALHQTDHWHEGFQWIAAADAAANVIAFIRTNRTGTETILFIANFSPSARTGYRVGVPASGFWKEIFNTDAREYGGGQGNFGGVQADASPLHGRPYSITVTVPPLAAIYFHQGR